MKSTPGRSIRDRRGSPGRTSARTVRPSARSRSVTWRPIRPLAPVTRTLTAPDEARAAGTRRAERSSYRPRRSSCRAPISPSSRPPAPRRPRTSPSPLVGAPSGSSVRRGFVHHLKHRAPHYQPGRVIATYSRLRPRIDVRACVDQGRRLAVPPEIATMRCRGTPYALRRAVQGLRQGG